MPLLVEDRGEPAVLERIPPWGDPSLKAYMAKFNDVFDSLETFPDFRIDFEISARELEDVANESPETLARMKALWKAGKLGFVGGDYSQSHYHVYGSESCFRQMEIGLSVFRDLIGCEIRVFFHQETGLHEQLPQLLKAFGYTVAVPPRFPWALHFTSGPSPEIASHYGTLEFLRDDDVTDWKGLDGTTIPLYLSMGAPSHSEEIIEVFKNHAGDGFHGDSFQGIAPFERFMARERYKAPVNVPRILIETPDMKRISEEYFSERSRLCSFSLLTDALDDCLKSRAPVGTASLYPYWSYIEGVWAEQMSRTNRRAEVAVFQAEALQSLASLAGRGAPADTGAIWKKILSSQHHDVYWIETTDLKRRAISWLDEAIEESEKLSLTAVENLCAQRGTEKLQREQAVAYNTLPFERSGASRLRILGDPRADGVDLLRRAFGRSLCILPVDTGSAELMIDRTVPGLGCVKSRIDGSVSPPPEAPWRVTTDPFEYDTDFYAIRIGRGGIIESLAEKTTGTELIGSSEVRANEIAGRLETGAWASSGDLRQQRLTVSESPQACVVSIQGSLGPVSFNQNVILRRASPRIDFRLTLGFGSSPVAIGDFWSDDTKLNVYWPLGGAREIVHDIPFGVVPARSGRPVYCTSFMDASDGRAGLSYFNLGTTKHWIRNNVLANVLAWGGNRFSNRHPGLWEYVDKYDLRLHGSHTIEYAIYPHPGDYRTGNVPRAAQDFTVPLCACVSGASPKTADDEPAGFNLMPKNLVCTAVLPNEKGMALRVYESHGREVGCNEISRSPGFAGCAVLDLGGRAIRTIEPFQICTIQVNR
jgi:alpha-mannosidase